MASTRTKVNARVPKEFSKIKKDEKNNDTLSVYLKNPANNDYSHWKACIKGPSDTPYEGGLFTIDIIIPSQYPFAPPKMKFDTKVWHPNISSQTGAICLDILKAEWSPALTIRTALISLQALLSTPEPDDPQDAVVANQFRTHHAAYEKQAKEWTQNYAHDVEPEQKIALVNHVCQMTGNTDRSKAALYLARYGWNSETAVHKILSGEN